MTTTREQSPYDGPIRTTEVRAGGQSIRLVRPGDPDRLLDDPEVAAWNASDDYMPYWVYLWPGAFLLSDALAAGSWAAGTGVLELGCGLGLPGLVALRLGLHVTFTDYDLTPLTFVRRSAAANGFDPASWTAARLDWRRPTAQRYPLILGADITYERRLIPLVAGVIAAQLAPGGLAIVSDPDRTAAAGLVEALGAVGLRAVAEPATGVGEGLEPVRGTLYRITWAD